MCKKILLKQGSYASAAKKEMYFVQIILYDAIRCALQTCRMPLAFSGNFCLLPTPHTDCIALGCFDERLLKQGSYASTTEIKKDVRCTSFFILAGETRFEHATNGFGDHYSTVEPLPYCEIDYTINVKNSQAFLNIKTNNKKLTLKALFAILIS